MKYLLACMLPAGIAFSLKCDASCAEDDPFWQIYVSLGFAYFLGGLFVIVAAFCLWEHPWLRWSHFFQFPIVRVPYGVLFQHASIIADAQFFLGTVKKADPQKGPGGGCTERNKNSKHVNSGVTRKVTLPPSTGPFKLGPCR